MLRRIPRQKTTSGKTATARLEPDKCPNFQRQQWLNLMLGLKHQLVEPGEPAEPADLTALQAQLAQHLPTPCDVAAHLHYIGVEVIVFWSLDVIMQLRENCPDAFARLKGACAHRGISLNDQIARLEAKLAAELAANTEVDEEAPARPRFP